MECNPTGLAISSPSCLETIFKVKWNIHRDTSDWSLWVSAFSKQSLKKKLSELIWKHTNTCCVWLGRPVARVQSLTGERGVTGWPLALVVHITPMHWSGNRSRIELTLGQSGWQSGPLARIEHSRGNLCVCVRMHMGVSLCVCERVDYLHNEPFKKWWCPSPITWSFTFMLPQ